MATWYDDRDHRAYVRDLHASLKTPHWRVVDKDGRVGPELYTRPKLVSMRPTSDSYGMYMIKVTPR